MKFLQRNINKNAILLFVFIFLLNLLISFWLNAFQMPNWDIISIKLVSSFGLATMMPLMINIMKEPIDPEYAFFILCFNLVASSMVLSFTVDYIRSLKTTLLVFDKEIILMDILVTGLFFICTLTMVIKTIYTIIKSKFRN